LVAKYVVRAAELAGISQFQARAVTGRA
jgi:hypothetical protein